jgi:hypothetical protein
MPAIYNYSAPAGSRWNRTGLTASTNERMYHSTAILLPDSSILIGGSNPNADFTNNQWRSRTDVEKWFPWYYNEVRPILSNPPTTLSYGGETFDISLGNITDEASVASAQLVVIRGGFNTHAIGFGQKFLQLESSYTIDMNSNSATLHVSQLPGNPGPTLFQPGPAMVFLVINGVPSEGEFVMVGSGQLGTQPTTTNAVLPNSQIKTVTPTSSSSTGQANKTPTSNSNTSSGGKRNGAGVLVVGGSVVAAVIGGLLI